MGRLGLSKNGVYNIGSNQTASDVDHYKTLSSRAASWLTRSLLDIQYLPAGKAANYFGFGYFRYEDRGFKGSNVASSKSLRSDSGKAMFDKLDDNQLGFFHAGYSQQIPLYAQYKQNRNQAIAMLYKLRESANAKIDDEAFLNATIAAGRTEATFGFQQAQILAAVINSLTPEQVEYFNKLRSGEIKYKVPEHGKQGGKGGKQGGKGGKQGGKGKQERATHRNVYGAFSGDQLAVAQLNDMGAKTFTWLTGSQSKCEWAELARWANYFGFASFRYGVKGNSTVGQSNGTRGSVSSAVSKLLNRDQVKILADAIIEERPVLVKLLDTHLKMVAQTWKLREGESADRMVFIQMGADLGRYEGMIGLSQAKALAKVFFSMDDKQKAALTALNPKGTPLNPDHGHGIGVIG